MLFGHSNSRCSCKQAIVCCAGANFCMPTDEGAQTVSCAAPFVYSLSAVVIIAGQTVRSEVNLLEAQAARRRGLPAAVAAVQFRAAAAGQSPRDVIRAAAAQQRPHHVPHLQQTKPTTSCMAEHLQDRECASTWCCSACSIRLQSGRACSSVERDCHGEDVMCQEDLCWSNRLRHEGINRATCPVSGLAKATCRSFPFVQRCARQHKLHT